jgi:hypothetical protein
MKQVAAHGMQHEHSLSQLTGPMSAIEILTTPSELVNSSKALPNVHQFLEKPAWA